LIREPEPKSIVATFAKVKFVDWLPEHKKPARAILAKLSGGAPTVEFDEILARKWQELVKIT
jgi:hypothetical protein